jgi:hypothetical protein
VPIPQTKKAYRVPAIRDLRADTPDGCCVFCQEPFVGGGRPGQDVCGASERDRDEAASIENECEKSYQRLRMSRRRSEQREVLNRTDTDMARRLIERAARLLSRVERRRTGAALSAERA